MDRLNTNELAEQISRFVNGASSSEVERLVDLMVQDHPTLQQSKMRLACLFIEKMADRPYTDARNEDSKRIAQSMIKGYKEAEKEKIIREDGGISKGLESFIDEKSVPSKSLPFI